MVDQVVDDVVSTFYPNLLIKWETAQKSESTLTKVVTELERRLPKQPILADKDLRDKVKGKLRSTRKLALQALKSLYPEASQEERESVYAWVFGEIHENRGQVWASRDRSSSLHPSSLLTSDLHPCTSGELHPIDTEGVRLIPGDKPEGADGINCDAYEAALMKEMAKSRPRDQKPAPERERDDDVGFSKDDCVWLTVSRDDGTLTVAKGLVASVEVSCFRYTAETNNRSMGIAMHVAAFK